VRNELRAKIVRSILARKRWNPLADVSA